MSETDSITDEPNVTHGLCKVLNQLMQECDIDDAKLSRQTGVPASTISRMRLNPDANPTAATLRPLAKFFCISIDQLLDVELIPDDRLPGTFSAQGYTSARVPIIEWEWITEWLDNKGENIKQQLTKWVSSEKELSQQSFALVVPTDSFGLAFQKGSQLIIDPERISNDGDYVLIFNNEKEILFRQIIKDGPDIYLRSANLELKGTKRLEAKVRFLGVVVEARLTLQESGVNTTSETLSFAGATNPLLKLVNQ